jgi:aminoglycoside 3-N-acetyltransferase
MTLTIVTDQLVTAVDNLRLADRPVMVHTSLRSFGEPINGGPDAVLDALLSRGCTVLVPSFTEPQFGVVPPHSMRPLRNGVDYAVLPEETAIKGAAYTVDCGLINSGMGAVPTRLIARTGVRRGRHPLNSFAALGPRSSELIDSQAPTDVYAPIRALMELRGAVLLIGVGLNRMTALHLAEQQSGRRLYVRWAQRPDGTVSMVETGSCSEGFPRLEPYLRDHARTTFVGAARWCAYTAKETVFAAATAMAAEQMITQCPDHRCNLCRDSIAGGPIGPAPLG